MKRKIIPVCILLAVILSVFAPASIASSKSGNDDIISNYKRECFHSGLYEFDDATMTVNGVYEENSVEMLLGDIACYSDNHCAVILKNGKEIMDGYLEEDMVVQIYHENRLYGEYTITKLLKPFPAPKAYNFILPVDNIVLLLQKNGGNISGFFNPNIHQGIDIARGGTHYLTSINGAPIRAVKGGIVTTSVTNYGTTSYGNNIIIDHENGETTRYAHMLNTPIFAVGQRVKQGQIIGYVGNTGDSTGPHLHFEVKFNGAFKDPMDYLNGAQTYNPLLDYQVGTIDTSGIFRIKTGPLNGGWQPDISNIASFKLANGKYNSSLGTNGNFNVQDKSAGTAWTMIANPCIAYQTEGNRFAILSAFGELCAKDNINGQWILMATNVKEFQLQGDKICMLQNNGNLSTKVGLNGTWGLQVTGVAKFQMTNEWLGIVNTSDELYVKEGLGGQWGLMMTNVNKFQIEGNQIVALQNNGNLSHKIAPGGGWSLLAHSIRDFQQVDNRTLALGTDNVLHRKESVNAGWDDIDINIASFKVSGERVAMLKSTQDKSLLVKDGWDDTFSVIQQGVVKFDISA